MNDDIGSNRIVLGCFRTIKLIRIVIYYTCGITAVNEIATCSNELVAIYLYRLRLISLSSS
jgi:hypothetical protein